MTNSNKTKRNKKPNNSKESSEDSPIADGNSESPDQTEPSNLFTFDAQSPDWTKLNSMPSVSRLLDRKKLVIDPAAASKRSSPPPAPPESTAEPETIEKTATLPAATYFEVAESEQAASLAPPPAPATSVPAPARVQPAQRRGSTIHVQPLYQWTSSQLKGTADPMGPGILDILKKGAVTVLFLSRDPSPQAGGATGFIAKAFSGDPAKASTWKGLKWNSNILSPDLWKFLLQEGSIEFSPSSTQTLEHSTRNILRTSFGAQKSEWLVLTRVGPESQVRGLIAIISLQSIHGPIRPALEAMWRSYVPQSSAPAK